MPNPIIHYFNCPNCGTVIGKRCVRCDAELYIQNMNGSRPGLPEGEDRRPEDMGQEEIQKRAAAVRNSREELRSEHFRWRHEAKPGTPRILRISRTKRGLQLEWE